MSDIWLVFLEVVLPLALVELLGAVVWRLVVVEGRLSSRTLEGESPTLEPEYVVNWEAVEELQEDVAALTQRVMDLEQELETDQ
jgi:hypothetical protein